MRTDRDALHCFHQKQNHELPKACNLTAGICKTQRVCDPMFPQRKLCIGLQNTHRNSLKASVNETKSCKGVPGASMLIWGGSSFPVTCHLTGGTFKNLIFRAPSQKCHVSGRKDRNNQKDLNQQESKLGPGSRKRVEVLYRMGLVAALRSKAGLAGLDPVNSGANGSKRKASAPETGFRSHFTFKGTSKSGDVHVNHQKKCSLRKRKKESKSSDWKLGWVHVSTFWTWRFGVSCHWKPPEGTQGPARDFLKLCELLELTWG